MAKFDLQEGNYTVPGAHIGIVAARFNQEVVDRLIEGAIDTLKYHGVKEENITIVRVPGAFELPITARRLAETYDLDAVITLGTVIRGGTPHFEYVAGVSAHGVSRVSLDQNLPVIFGVLTTDNTEDAMARAGGEEGNKGSESALAALEMIALFRQIAGLQDQ
uniref:6,7-dimethyl-8-ribityllumazine synthase n=1 Tax=Candidatus Kentrum sp. TUN TaxID=2126343 RepID=A0A451AN41_9GAMM|nr:MAG: 6,7-dimethyl-8-ribityllumazine synthase [Candidatus Kentron sp. TUN]VFK63299.1 MAG: 6,7-dimethyl-8-ribityllumazine synthase [Candidatus Kentron sp. TUN]VFK67463.1 MAG: 6,7-dimethyl-8-ribityllumazine synthase [Candidatus Kentron sp. TUN]